MCPHTTAFSVSLSLPLSLLLSLSPSLPLSLLSLSLSLSLSVGLQNFKDDDAASMQVSSLLALLVQKYLLYWYLLS
jgi:hypothetical protein